ncbi:ABC transporter permease [Clostridium cuniculi]|uniref:ABC transporter permease n=1 Tax=Clostridium cuniculi TaxID=2548455 RepID=UPI003083F6AE
MNKIKFKPYLLALAPFLLLILLFELLPLCSIIFKSFMEEGSGGFTFDNYINVFSKPIYRQAIINSITISIISAAVGIVVAFIGAKAAHNTESLMKRVFMSILNMTSNFAGVPLAFSFIILLGKTGVLVILAKALGIENMANFDIYSNNGLILIYIYFQIPLATLLLIPAFNALREEYREAVKILRANSIQYWIHVGLPILMPSLLSTFSVLFANSLVAYGTAYALLSGNASLLPIRISEMFVGDLTQRVELGSALSVVLLLLMALAFGVNNMITRKLRKDVK